jgi:hypothetical protein
MPIGECTLCTLSCESLDCDMRRIVFRSSILPLIGFNGRRFASTSSPSESSSISSACRFTRISCSVITLSRFALLVIKDAQVLNAPSKILACFSRLPRVLTIVTVTAAAAFEFFIDIVKVSRKSLMTTSARHYFIAPQLGNKDLRWIITIIHYAFHAFNKRLLLRCRIATVLSLQLPFIVKLPNLAHGTLSFCISCPTRNANESRSFLA